MNLEKFKELPILGIIRGIQEKAIDQLTETLLSSGLETCEITMNTKDAHISIKRMLKRAAGKLTVGAGTVLSMNDLKTALQSGASFIVMPTLVKDVTEYCVKNKIPVFPGALTPQEIYNAWCAGATMVKIFPTKFFGPDYLKEIKGPFQDVELLACGGVNPGNIRSFFEKGASGAAFGGSVFSKKRLETGDFSGIEKDIKALIKAYKNS